MQYLDGGWHLIDDACQMREQYIDIKKPMETSKGASVMVLSFMVSFA